MDSSEESPYIQGLRDKKEWRASPEWRQIVKISVAVAAITVLWICLATFAAWWVEGWVSTSIWAIISILPIVFSLRIIEAAIDYRNRKHGHYRERLALEEADRRSAQLVAGGHDAGSEEFAELWVLTSKRLHGYHQRAQEQADQSFRNAQLAIAGGFLIVAGTAIIIMWKGNLSVSSSIVVGAMGAVGGALSAYVGRTFLRLQETTSKHMRSYFDQPQETFRYLMAERLIDRLPEGERSRSVEYLVQAVMLSGLPVEQLVSGVYSAQQAQGGASPVQGLKTTE